MQRNNTRLDDSNENNKKFIIPVHDEVTFKDIAKYLDIQMQDNIKNQLEGIDEEVEKLGKVCDNLYKQSYEEYKNILDKEREDLDNNVKKYISNLKDNLIGLRNRINYDYKGKYNEVNSKLTKLVEELKITTKQNVKLQYKKDDLMEDCSFYEKQIDDMKDMNIYLKYKLKLFLGDIQEEEEGEEINQQQQSDKDNEMINLEKNTYEDNNKINNNRYNSENIENNHISENNNKINEYNNNSKNIKNELNKEDEKNEEDKLYITATKNLYNSNKKKKRKVEFDEVEYVNSKLDLEEAQLMNYIHHEKFKNSKLSEIYNTLFIKTTNPYFSNLKELIEDQKSINSSKSLEKSSMNESTNLNNRSNFPSVYNSTKCMSNSVSINKSKNFYTPSNPGPGYITRKENKEIMLKFLDNLETKKAIYKLLYGE